MSVGGTECPLVSGRGWVEKRGELVEGMEGGGVEKGGEG